MIQRRSPLKVPKPKKQPKPIIRSSAFRQKYEEGMPRINHKAIPFHNVYDIQVSDIKIAEERGLKFWGCVMPQPRKFKTRKVQTSRQPARTTDTRGEAMLKKYLKRRPSLTLTPRSFYSPTQKQDRLHQTIGDFQNLSKTFCAPINPEDKVNETIDSFMLTNEGDISKLNSKSLYQMSPDELKVSIMWKKRFLQLFQKQVEESKNVDYVFKPYHS